MIYSWNRSGLRGGRLNQQDRCGEVFEHTVTVSLIDNRNIDGNFAIMTWHDSVPLTRCASLRKVYQIQRGGQSSVAAAEYKHLEGCQLRRSIKLRTHGETGKLPLRETGRRPSTIQEGELGLVYKGTTGKKKDAADERNC